MGKKPTIEVIDLTTPEDAARGDSHIMTIGPTLTLPEGMTSEEFTARWIAVVTGISVEEARELKPIDFYAVALSEDDPTPPE